MAIEEKQIDNIVKLNEVLTDVIAGSLDIPVTIPAGLSTELTLSAIKDTDGIKKITDTVTTKEQASATLVCGQNAAVGTTASAIGSSQVVSEIIVQASPNNTVNVLLGNSTSQTILMQPGASITVPAANVNMIYAKTASGTATVNWLGRS